MKKMIYTALCVLLVVSGFSEGLTSPKEKDAGYSANDAFSTRDNVHRIVTEPAIDTEYMTIGEGKKLYSFAVFTDVQGEIGKEKLQAAVDAVIALNNDADPDNDIQFVIVLGDLIHGVTQDFLESKDEAGYRDEYNLIKTILERLEEPRPAGAGIYYIPLLGNHDVWCLYDMYVHNNVFPDYPEALFAARDTDGEGGYFGSQYDELSQNLPGWVSQPLPVSNPYPGDHPDTIYFENFAFDFGLYHFICLDFCARDDFDPVGLGVPPGLKKFWGYADVHETVSNGTYDWLETHLDYCQRKGITNVIIFSHHPVIYQLEALNDSIKLKVPIWPYYLPFAFRTDIKGELHVVNDPSGWFKTATILSNCRSGSGFAQWNNQKLHDSIEVNRVEGDAAFAFNNADYDCQNEYGSLVNLFSQYNITIVHWFSGHYHLKGFHWVDPYINAPMSVVPSIAPAKDIYGINFTGEVKLNDLENAVITPKENPHGSFTLVTVMGSYTRPRTDTDADQTSPDADADSVTDDNDQCFNPGCSLVDETGCPIDSDSDGIPDCDDSCPEEAGTKKNGCPKAGNSGFLVVLGIIVARWVTRSHEVLSGCNKTSQK